MTGGATLGFSGVYPFFLVESAFRPCCCLLCGCFPKCGCKRDRAWQLRVSGAALHVRTSSLRSSRRLLPRLERRCAARYVVVGSANFSSRLAPHRPNPRTVAAASPCVPPRVRSTSPDFPCGVFLSLHFARRNLRSRILVPPKNFPTYFPEKSK